MSEIINQPTPNTPQTTAATPTIEQTPQKRKYFLMLISLLILILAVAGGVYYYFNLRQTGGKGITTTLVTPSAPTENPVPTSAEVSNSTDTSVLEKELNDTDPGSFEKDVNQLDLDAGQL